MHARGWMSIYCNPPRPAFKGSAPINLSDRLNQVLRWALGSIEILLSRHCPIWYGYTGRLRLLERLAYINTIVYPITALPLIAYCILPAFCLITDKFIIPEVRKTEPHSCLPFSNCNLHHLVSKSYNNIVADKQLREYLVHSSLHLHCCDWNPGAEMERCEH